MNGTKLTNLFENHPAQWILKDAGIEQPANFAARSAFDQHTAQEPQRICFEQWPARRLDRHKNQSFFTAAGESDAGSVLRLETKRRGRDQSQWGTSHDSDHTEALAVMNRMFLVIKTKEIHSNEMMLDGAGLQLRRGDDTKT